MKNIVIMESLGIPAEELASLKKPFEEKGCTFHEYARTSDIPTLIREAQNADAMILANMPMPGEVLRACSRLKFIDIAFTGVDHVDLAAAKDIGACASNASGYSNEAVSELVIGMTLSLLRNIPAMDTRCRNAGTGSGLLGSEIRGKTVGIIGLGKIGTRTAELFHAFGAEILAQNRTHHENAPDYAAQVSREELLKRSDIVVLHCPLNDSTRGMINAGNLALMKRNALLVNVARGPVVVAQDLADALNHGVIAAAAVDVFDREPPLDSSEPLLNAKNILLTPHIAFATEQSMSLRAKIVFENLAAWMDGAQINSVL